MGSHTIKGTNTALGSFMYFAGNTVCFPGNIAGVAAPSTFGNLAKGNHICEIR